MGKRLFIDMTKCDSCEKCTVDCGAFYRAKATDHGILTLREMAQFALICRRCENACCVAACRFEALEREEDGVLKRHNLRCVSCKCCSQACPFGTIYPDTVPFYVTKCDFCMTRIEGVPPCVPACINRAVEYRDVEESEKDAIYVLSDHLAIRAPKWDKKDV